MPIQQDIIEFQKSITQELKFTKNRVRNLIGDASWGQDGSYKEAILRKIIAQFLPSNLSIGTGFIVRKENYIENINGTVSNQLDIIIYENKTSVIFREGDFVILTDKPVRAVIEVKTKVINYSNINSRKPADNALNIIVEKLNRLREFPSFINNNANRKKFVGIFSYEYQGDFQEDNIAEAMRNSNGLVNHISLGSNNFIRYWENTNDIDPPLDFQGRFYMRYVLENLSFSYFISNLIHIVSDEDPIERYWFSFPIEGTKERYRNGEPIRLN